MSPDRRTRRRTCIGCRRAADQEAMVRLRLRATGRPQVDEKRRLPGRGAYLCPARECLEQAMRRGAFSRAFRTKVTDDGLAEFEAEFAAYLRVKGPVGAAPTTRA